MAFNLNKLALQEIATLQLVSPESKQPLFADDEETLPLTIAVYGKTSKVYRKWQAEASRKVAARKGKILSDTAEIEDTADWLATITSSISNFDIDGVPLNSFESYKSLYSNLAFSWVGEQVVEFLRSGDSFLTK